MVADRLECDGIGIDISDEYIEMARERIEDDLRDRLSPWDDDYPDEPANDPEETIDSFSDLMDQQ